MNAIEAFPVAQTVALLKKQLGAEAVIRCSEPMSKRTTLRVGGPADIFVEPASEADLQHTVTTCAQLAVPWMMLGRGSNLLVRDGGIRGVVISLGAFFTEITVQGKTLFCRAGARLRSVAFEAKKHSLTGFEFMEGIPGNVGGALRMNAGAMGSSIFELVESVRMMSPRGAFEERKPSEIPFEYRNCPLLSSYIALSTVLHGQNADRAQIDARMNECSQKRWTSQPAAPSAGCIFKNSHTVSSGRLVQELGLKGTRIGGAVISDVHGNFIVNEGNASARDVLDLIELIKDTAWRKRQIDLHTEVQIVGED